MNYTFEHICIWPDRLSPRLRRAAEEHQCIPKDSGCRDLDCLFHDDCKTQRRWRHSASGAACSGHVECLELAWLHGARGRHYPTNKEYGNAAIVAAAKGHWHCLRFLIDCGWAFDLREALRAATVDDRLDCVRILMAECTRQGEFSTEFQAMTCAVETTAARAGSIACLKMIHARWGTINRGGIDRLDVLLQEVLKSQKLDCVMMLHSWWAKDISFDLRQKQILDAVKVSSVECIEWLYERYADRVHPYDCLDESLCIAARRGQIDVIRCVYALNVGDWASRSLEKAFNVAIANNVECATLLHGRGKWKMRSTVYREALEASFATNDWTAVARIVGFDPSLAELAFDECISRLPSLYARLVDVNDDFASHVMRCQSAVESIWPHVSDKVLAQSRAKLVIAMHFDLCQTLPGEAYDQDYSDSEEDFYAGEVDTGQALKSKAMCDALQLRITGWINRRAHAWLCDLALALYSLDLPLYVMLDLAYWAYPIVVANEQSRSILLHMRRSAERVKGRAQDE